MPITLEDASTVLIRWLRAPRQQQGLSHYGYDLYVPNVLREHLGQQGIRDHEAEQALNVEVPAFLAAAWDLCRRGILRPGIRNVGMQATDEGSAGAGYSITPFGQQWLLEANRDDFVPTEPGRFAQMLAAFEPRFGQGFHERSQEAIRCYGAHAYLACCAMCGAATESILLTTAAEKTKDLARVHREYMASGGRRRVENIILGQARQQLKDEYRGYTSLLKYWRDSASHGHAAGITDNESYTALALLLRFASFANDNWTEFIA